MPQTATASNSKTDKVPPHSIDSEQAVLGGILLDQDAWDRVADRMSAADFYLPEHRAIFQAIAVLASRNQPLDRLTVFEELKTNHQTQVSEIYLLELANNIPSIANVAAYADLVRERSILRQLISASAEIADSAFNLDGREAKEILDIAEQKIFNIAEQKNRGEGPLAISHILVDANQHLEKLQALGGGVTGLATGFIDFDKITSGLHAGDLVVVAGRPSMGKTAFAMNIAENAAGIMKKPVLVFSMEMPAEQLAIRMLSSHGRTDQHKLRTGNLSDQDWVQINSAVTTLSPAPLFIDDTPALSPAEMRARARRMKRMHGDLSLIVVDYLQLMQIPGSRENRTAEISEISRFMKTLAKEMDVPVIALSQLNRSLEQRQNRRPMMSDLRESGAIEQDADLIAFIYRDEVYNKDTLDKGIAEVIIAKQRNGPTGDIKLTFLGQYTRFENFTMREANEVQAS